MNIFKKCPKCFSSNVIKFAYGFPSIELIKRYEEGKVKLGGCCIEPDSPVFYCKDCENEWTKQQAIDAFYSYINTIELQIGGCFSLTEIITINMKEKHILYQIGRSDDDEPFSYPLKGENLSKIKNALKNDIQILNWKLNYFNKDILDGEQWEIVITFINALKPVKIYGDNAYPKEWDTLNLLLSELTQKNYKYEVYHDYED